MQGSDIGGVAQRRLSIGREGLQPRVLDIQQASGLAAAVLDAVAPHLAKHDGVRDATNSVSRDGVAYSVRLSCHDEPPAEQPGHLWHEGQAVEIAHFVERRGDFSGRAKLDPIARPELDITATHLHP